MDVTTNCFFTIVLPYRTDEQRATKLLLSYLCWNAAEQNKNRTRNKKAKGQLV